MNKKTNKKTDNWYLFKMIPVLTKVSFNKSEKIRVKKLNKREKLEKKIAKMNEKAGN